MKGIPHTAHHLCRQQRVASQREEVVLVDYPLLRPPHQQLHPVAALPPHLGAVPVKPPTYLSAERVEHEPLRLLHRPPLLATRHSFTPDAEFSCHPSQRNPNAPVLHTGPHII